MSICCRVMCPNNADRMANSEDLIRLLLKKQSDLGLLCLLRKFRNGIPLFEQCVLLKDLPGDKLITPLLFIEKFDKT